MDESYACVTTVYDATMSTVSPQEIAARVGLDAKELEKPCEEGLFPFFANYVHPWCLVFSDLLAPIDLDDVNLECNSEQEKRLACLRKWKARRGVQATVGALIGSVLRNAGSVDNAESMCRRLLSGAVVLKLESYSKNVKQEVAVQDYSMEEEQIMDQEGSHLKLQNIERIQSKFASLLLTIRKALEAKKVTVTDVRQFLMDINLGKLDIPCFSEFIDFFMDMSKRQIWNYVHYSPLVRVAEQFLNDNDHIHICIKKYKADLSGFYFATKLIDYMKTSNPCIPSNQQSLVDLQQFTAKEYIQLKSVLGLGMRKITTLSLEYVNALWRSLAEEFDLPSPTAIIKEIVCGSLEITWLILPHLADIILLKSKKPKAVKFFRAEVIILLQVDDVTVYDEQTMVEHERKLLTLCRRGPADIKQITSLLDQGVDPNIEEEGVCRTALTVACCNGHKSVAELLIHRGANVNHKDKNGLTPLHYATDNKHVDIMKLLLDKNAEIDVPTKAIADELLQKETDADCYNKPPLHLSESHKGIIRESWKVVEEDIGLDVAGILVCKKMIEHSPSYQMTLLEEFPGAGVEELLDNENVKKHALQMTESLSAYISMLDHMDELHDTLKELGVIHQQKNIQALYIDEMRMALISTFEDKLGREFTPGEKEAWRALHQIISNDVKEGLELDD